MGSEVEEALEKEPKERSPKDLILISKQIEGELGDKYYIIMKGSVGISVQVVTGKGKQAVTTEKEVGRIQSGMSFGELALLFNSIRNATITTLQESAFIVLTKDVFQNYMKFKTPPNAEDVLKFFDAQEFFKENTLALPQKIQIVSKCDTKQFVSNAAILLQGQHVDSLHFLKKGLIKVYRKVQFKVYPGSGEIDVRSNSDPTEKEIAQGLYQELFLEIDEMYEGSLIAEYELLSFKTSQCSFLAYTPTEVVSINRSDLQILPERMLSKFQRQAKPYPPDSKLRTVFFQGMHWKTFKKDMVQFTNIETKNQRNVIGNKIMDREQPYSIPHEANLYVLDDSFNRDQEEDESQLEKSAFEPLNKFFNGQEELNSDGQQQYATGDMTTKTNKGGISKSHKNNNTRESIAASFSESFKAHRIMAQQAEQKEGMQQQQSKERVSPMNKSTQDNRYQKVNDKRQQKDNRNSSTALSYKNKRNDMQKVTLPPLQNDNENGQQSQSVHFNNLNNSIKEQQQQQSFSGALGLGSAAGYNSTQSLHLSPRQYQSQQQQQNLASQSQLSSKEQLISSTQLSLAQIKQQIQQSIEPSEVKILSEEEKRKIIIQELIQALNPKNNINKTKTPRQSQSLAAQSFQAKKKRDLSPLTKLSKNAEDKNTQLNILKLNRVTSNNIHGQNNKNSSTNTNSNIQQKGKMISFGPSIQIGRNAKMN